MVRFSAYVDVDSSEEETEESLRDASVVPITKGKKPTPAEPEDELDALTDVSDEEQDETEPESETSSAVVADETRPNGRGRSARRSATPSSPSESPSTSRDPSSDSSAPPRLRTRRSPSHAHVTDPSIIPWAQQLGIESQRIHVMQAALFNRQQDETSPLPRQKSPWATLNIPSSQPTLNRKHSRDSEAADGLLKQVQRPSFAHDIDPVPFRPSRKYARVERTTSAVEGNEGVVVDAALALGRSFRVGWGPGGSLVHLGRLCSPASEGKTTASCFVVSKTQVPFATQESTNLSSDLMVHHLNNTSITTDANNIPFAEPKSDLTFSSFAALFPAAATPDALLFRLGQALFDPIDTRLPANAPEELVTRITALRRRLAFSRWLELSVQSTVDAEIRGRPLANPTETIFSLLTGHRVEKATNHAADEGYAHLSTLLTQIGGDAEFRADMAAQLDAWRKEKADAHIPPSLRKLYALLAGVTGVLHGSGGTGAEQCPDLRVDDGLDWKRSFGLRLWYSVPLDMSLADAWVEYEHARHEEGATSPVPWYIEKPPVGSPLPWKLPEVRNGQPIIEDVLYALLRLYSDPECSLEDVMSSFGFGPSPLDYSLPWHLYITLSRVMRIRDFLDRGVVDEEEENDQEDGQVDGHSPTADLLTNAYASQLEAAGHIQEAAFVLLHIEGSRWREKAIKDLLARSAPLLNDWHTPVLAGSLRIPQQWIAEAQAVYALGEDDSWEAYDRYVSAGLYDEAHSIVVRDLAPETVIRGDHSLLVDILSNLERHEDAVHNWQSGGKVFLEWSRAISRLKALSLRLSDEPDAVPDAADSDAVDELSRTVPRLLALLPEVLSSKEDARHRVALQEMVSSLTLGMNRVDPLAIVNASYSSAAIDSSTRLKHNQAAALRRFEQTIAATW